ncbi:MAG TPA: SRPBCC family protein [Bacteroidota bacterium]|nr:SRPBCC family protein [Bacteroidota bacterium]
MESGGEVEVREIVSTRVYDVSPERLFEAWTDPDQISKWWGPKGFTNTFHVFDPRPGGVWKFIMHGPNGGNYPNESHFIEVQKPERIVFRHVSPPFFLTTATFERVGSQTRLVWRMLFDTAEEYRKVASFAVEGNLQNLDRLQVHLSGGNVGDGETKNAK